MDIKRQARLARRDLSWMYRQLQAVKLKLNAEMQAGFADAKLEQISWEQIEESFCQLSGRTPTPTRAGKILEKFHRLLCSFRVRHRQDACRW